MSGTRVLLVGFDAAERSIVLDLAARGRMPAVRSLLDRGHRTDLDAPDHVYVGAVWPTLYTGATPGHHGRWAPQLLPAGSYETTWVGADSGIEPFWGPLARAGQRIAAVDVPLAPLVPQPNVVQLSEWRTHDNAGPVDRWVDGRDPFGDLPVEATDSCDRYHREGRLGDLRTDLLAGMERKTALVERLLDDSDWDLLFAVYGESHCVGHQCWFLHDADHPRHDVAALEAMGDPITDVYEALDSALGRLLARLDDETTVGLVLSHGMGPHYDGGHLLGEALRRIEDTLLGPPPAVARWRGSAERAVRRAGRRLTGDTASRGAGRFGRALDGSRRFLSVPNAAPVGAVRLNLQGREPHGRVALGEFESVCELLARELGALVDPEDGQPLVRRVTRVEAEHDGPHTRDMGDLFVEWRRDRPIDAVASPTVGVIRVTYDGVRSGDHHRGGLLVGAGPAVDAAPFGSGLEGTALAPIVRGWLGVDVAEPVTTAAG